MVMFRHEEESYEQGQYVLRREASPENGLDPVVEIVEDLGTIEVPCGKVDCGSDCLEYVVRSAGSRPREGFGYNLAECKIWPLVNVL
jgi:hypothetical protein